jgi:hypothetical protein
MKLIEYFFRSLAIAIIISFSILSYDNSAKWIIFLSIIIGLFCNINSIVKKDK